MMLSLDRTFTCEHECADLRLALSPGQPGGSPITAVQAGEGRCTAAVHHILKGKEPDQRSAWPFCLPLLTAACSVCITSVRFLLAVTCCAALLFLRGCSIQIAIRPADATR